MKSYDDPKKLKDELLLTGGLIISNRRSGKTIALLNILHEYPDKILVVPTEWARKCAISLYKEMFKPEKDDLKRIDQRIIDEKTFWGKRGIRAEQILIDEYFEFQKPPKMFFAAVGSMFFPVQIIRILPDYSNDLKKLLSENEYSISVSLEFESV